MSLRNELQPIPGSKPVRSLRWQLMLWYGSLVAISLGLFAFLVLVLITDAINTSIDDTIRAESKVATINLEKELLPAPPYWPAQLTLTAIDTYSDPGVAIEVRDITGMVRYRSASSLTSITIQDNLTQATQSGQPKWYSVLTPGGHIRVEAQAIYPPGYNNTNSQAIGMLLVAKSFEDIDRTLLMLRTLLILSGLTALLGALTGAWAIAANVLRPLGEIVKTARSIASTTQGTHLGNLSQRARRPSNYDEMVEVIDTFNEMLAALENASQAQRRFVADASHELRAPLTTIQGNLAFLQRHADDLPSEERRTMLSDAHQETLRLARLVDELLLLARADANTESLPASEEHTSRAMSTPSSHEKLIELDHTLLQLVRQLRGRMSTEGSKVKLEVGHIEPVRIYGDEETLRRAMLILLDNALKYTPMNTEDGSGRITVSLERMDNKAVLRVHDTGIGIETEDLAHIFERFYRADRARSRQGTGLGLPIAQTLVEQLGGHITAESIPGQGSTFSIWLPLKNRLLTQPMVRA